MSMYFPKRDELSFLFVLALPNASNIEFDWMRMFFTLKKSFLSRLQLALRNENIFYYLDAILFYIEHCVIK